MTIGNYWHQTLAIAGSDDSGYPYSPAENANN